MKKLPDCSHEMKKDRRQGFALVLALSLMSLVFLLVVSLVSLVGTDLNLAELRKQKVLAQANARLGMMVALGEIQKHLGPDTRISATADILDERVESGDDYLSKNYDPDLSVSSGIDLNENKEYDKLSFGQRHWTGVWKNRAKSVGGSGNGDKPGSRPLPFVIETGNSVSDPMPDSEFGPHPAVEVAWLVSGNEGYEKRLGVFQGSGSFISRLDYIEIPDGIEKDLRSFHGEFGGQISSYGQEENPWADYQGLVEEIFSNRDPDEYIPNYYHPLVELPDPDDSNVTVWMLKKPLLKSTYYEPGVDPKDWKSHLAGEPVKVRKTEFNMPNEDGGSSSSSAYAYWVGDEGVKTKANLVNPNKGDNDWDDLTVASEPNLESGFGISFAQSIEEQRQDIFSLDMLSEIDEVTSTSSEKSDILAAHYHSLTTDSYGVLADVRTGGLKRDLSSAFAVQSESTWEDDFKGYLYQDRIFYLKSVSFKPQAKANEWNDMGSGEKAEAIFDYNTILAGPRWSVLKDFHNKWKKLESSDELAKGDMVPDDFPRITGDNNVLFKERPKSNGTELSNVSGKKLVDLVNYLSETTKRPEPKKHSVLPSLVEFKFSAVPYFSNGFPSLAMTPSVAFWNPYNVPIELDTIFVEIPMNVHMTWMNSREWDLLFNWFYHDPSPPPTSFFQIPYNSTTSNTEFPAATFTHPGSNPFIDLNGNGKRDPGEPRSHIPRPRPPRPPNQGGGGGGPRPPYLPYSRGDLLADRRFNNNNLYYETLNVGNIGHPKTGQKFSSFRAEYGPLLKSLNDRGRIRRWNFFRSILQDQVDDKTITPASPNGKEIYANMSPAFAFPKKINNPNAVNENPLFHERYLLLSIPKLKLDPGEKSHFVLKSSTVWPWEELKSGRDKRHYIRAELGKGDEETPYALICQSGMRIAGTEPLTLKFHIGDISGVSKFAKEDFNRAGERENSGTYFKPQGITVYANDPSNTPIQNQIRIKKINKHFNLDIGSQILDLAPASSLSSIDYNDYLLGNGVRLRWELPGLSDTTLFNQLNPRSLIDSYQDGFGDNWKVVQFISTAAVSGLDRRPFYQNNPRMPVWPRQPFPVRLYNGGYPVKNQPLDDTNFPGLDALNLPGFDLESVSEWGVPKAYNSSGAGFFHDDMKIDSDIDSKYHTQDGYVRRGKDAKGMKATRSAVMFDLPRSPLLSIAQFKHANINNYAHGPAYVIGNSYASTQVGRYKANSRACSLLIEPKMPAGRDIEWHWNKFNFWADNPAFGEFPGQQPKFYVKFFNWDNRWSIKSNASIRDTGAETEHQNITVDHSFNANRALFDGYFLSGVENLADFSQIPSDLEPGDRYRPFRNSRLIPFLRNGNWELVEYDQNLADSQKPGLPPNKELRYQTLAGDLMVEGAFNINSTSVDAWVAQLTALKEVGHSVLEYPEGHTPFPRFFSEIEGNSWNVICSLNDEEIKDLAVSLVKQVKLRGPFLSYSDFVNRRLQTWTSDERVSTADKEFSVWPKETRVSSLGLRGAMQAAIADAKINQGGFKFQLPSPSSLMGNPPVPSIPSRRFSSGRQVNQPLNPSSLQSITFQSSDFGLHAISQYKYKNPNPLSRLKNVVFSFPEFTDPSYGGSYIAHFQSWGQGSRTDELIYPPPGGGVLEIDGTQESYNYELTHFKNAFSYGEAPDNILAVENVATAVNKPGWLMQADVLSPLAPVSSARSDTFTVRVMGESPVTNDQPFSSRAWIELTVQRTPDYVKAELDSPHHRPHEPFEDKDFDGIWNNREEHWLDLNQNSRDKDGNDVTNGIAAGPDLPGVGKTGAEDLFADGLKTDLKLNEDKFEETLSIPEKEISTRGINQRFGRKFKIVQFRWLNENDV